MKISVSLPEGDVGFVDEYMAQTKGLSRSAVIHQAIALLRTASLQEAYVAAWDEWESGGDAELWEATVSDGLADASR